MIRYRLRCENGHDFDGWYTSSEAFERLRDAGHVTCVHCASTRVDKGLMAPALVGDTPAAEPADKPTAEPAPPSELERLREAVEQNSDYVGNRFVREARAMHDGDAPERPIHGEARLDEARALIEDGVPVLPLPFVPRQKRN